MSEYAKSQIPLHRKVIAIGLLSTLFGLEPFIDFITGFVISEESHALERLAGGYLLGFMLLVSIALGCLFFVGLQHVTNSLWSIVIRRVTEMLAQPAWLALLLFIPLAVMAWDYPETKLYAWRTATNHISAQAPAEAGHPEGAQAHADNPFKKIYYRFDFWAARGLLCLLLWGGFARYYFRRSRQQDQASIEEAWQLRAEMKRRSTVFMLVFAATTAVISVDWLMSLTPAWYSTIFPVYIFAGLVLTGLAVVTLFTLGLRRAGQLGETIKRPHLYSLGGLLFAFSCFWAYIAFSQFLLIWYGNLPEEIEFYLRRFAGSWRYVTWLLAAARFVIPFLTLLGKSAKSNPITLMVISVVILAGQAIDLYWLIMPSISEKPGWGLAEIGPAFFMMGLFLVYVGILMSRYPMQVIGEPAFKHSVNLQV